MLDSRPFSYRGNKEEKLVSLSPVKEERKREDGRKERKTVLASKEGLIWCPPPPKVLYLKQKKERQRGEVAIYTPVPPEL